MKQGKIIVGILALLALVYLISRNGHEASTPAEPAVLLFEKIDVENLNYFGFLSSDVSYVFVRLEGGVWKMISPLESRVDQEALDSFFNFVASLKAYDKISASEIEADVSAYGLTAPDGYIRLKTAEAEEVLSIGAVNPVSRRFYAQLQSSADIYLLSAGVLRELTAKVAKLRSRELFTFEPSLVENIVILSHQREPVTLHRNDPGWELQVQGLTIPTDSSKVQAAISQLVELRSDSVTDLVGPELGIYGLDESATTVSFVMSDPQQSDLTVRFGEGIRIDKERGELVEKKAFYAKSISESAVFQFRSDHFVEWRNPAKAFRSKLLFSSQPKVSFARKVNSSDGKRTAVCVSIKTCQRLSTFFKDLGGFESLEDDAEQSEVLLLLEYRQGDSEAPLSTLVLMRDESGYLLQQTVSRTSVWGRISDIQANLLLEELPAGRH